jgi:hypothetical protein
MSIMIKQGDKIQLWYLSGFPGTYFVTKMEAEVACRKYFPGESEPQRYARVCYIQSEPFQDIG